MMSVLTNDDRFEEAANAVAEGDEVKNMCDVLDRVEKRHKSAIARILRIDEWVGCSPEHPTA